MNNQGKPYEQRGIITASIIPRTMPYSKNSRSSSSIPYHEYHVTDPAESLEPLAARHHRRLFSTPSKSSAREVGLMTAIHANKPDCVTVASPATSCRSNRTGEQHNGTPLKSLLEGSITLSPVKPPPSNGAIATTAHAQTLRYAGYARPLSKNHLRSLRRALTIENGL